MLTLSNLNLKDRYTNHKGEDWTREEIDQVWEKGKMIPNYTSDIWRLDSKDSLINYFDFGNTRSQYGWEISHIKSVYNGGTNAVENLQPLNWVNNLLNE